MRGPAYSTDRELSHEFEQTGSPSTPSFIDPALAQIAGPAYSPAYYTNGGLGHVHEPMLDMHVRPSETPPLASLPYPPYSQQGPQGDPFAPQLPPAHFYPKEEELQLQAPSTVQQQQKAIKRKRRVKTGENCATCRGTDEENAKGESERMVRCHECGLSVHPSCHGLGNIADKLFTYPWKCVECKNCEVCKEKGDEARMVFCDNCDRGWHCDCVTPKLENTPDGDWHCPMCPPLPAESEATPTPVEETAPSVEPEIQIDPALQMEIDPALMEGDVNAASEHEQEEVEADEEPTPQPKRNKGKGKARASVAVSRVAVEESEDVDAEGDDEEMEEEQVVNRAASKRKLVNGNGKKGKSRGRRRSVSVMVAEDVPPPSPPPRPQKRLRMRVSSPPPTPQLVPQPTSPLKKLKLPILLRLPPKGKGKGKARAGVDEDEKDEEERKGMGMFDEYLNVEERDTTRTTVLVSDKERFERSRVVAETKLVPPTEKATSPLLTPGPASTSRFPLRSAMHHQHHPPPALLTPTSPSPSTPGPSFPFAKFDPNQLRIRTLRIGAFDISTWYDAPFPEEFSNCPEGRLWMCEFCLKYMKSRFGAQRHRLKCKARHPPGDEIYRDDNISIFEVDGRKNKIYCQNLCLLSKMFLDHKSLFYDVEPFLFYVMTEVDEGGAHFVGYFSKEKRNSKNLNLSCIMTLPVRQRQGWGNLLIDFSYLLSKKEQVVGTPERPLSGLGALGYKNYWTLAIMRYLHTAPANPRLEDISAATSMTLEDIYSTLSQQCMITVRESTPEAVRPSPGRSIRIQRGRKAGIARKQLTRKPTATSTNGENEKRPFVPPARYDIHWDPEKVEEYLAAWERKGYLKLKPDRLKWTPFLLSRKGEENNEFVDIVAMTTGTASNTSQRETSELVNGYMEVEEAPEALIPQATPLRATSASEGTPQLSRGPTNGLEQLAELALAMQPMDTPVRVNGNLADLNIQSAERPMDKYRERDISPSPAGRMMRTRSSRSKNDELPITESPKILHAPPLTNGRMSTRRSARSHHQIVSSPEPEPEPEPEAEPEEEVKSTTLDEDEPMQSILDRDAELAAKLALEEARPPPRRLRSTSSRSVPQEAPTPNAIETVQPSASRKKAPASRPREPSQSPASPTISRRPATRSAAAAVTTTERSTRRVSSRLNIPVEESPSVRTRSSRNDNRASKRINGVKAPDPVSNQHVPKKTPSPRKSARTRKATKVEDEVVAEERATPEREVEVPIEADSEMDAEGEEVDEDAEGSIDDGYTNMDTIPADRVNGILGDTHGQVPGTDIPNSKENTAVEMAPSSPQVKLPSSSSSLNAAAYPTPFSVARTASPTQPNGTLNAVAPDSQSLERVALQITTGYTAKAEITALSAQPVVNPILLEELGSDADAEGEIDAEGEWE